MMMMRRKLALSAAAAASIVATMLVMVTLESRVGLSMWAEELGVGADELLQVQVDGQNMKHIVIDKVYFPENRKDMGIAQVHGIVNGQYVQGNLRLTRTAKYHPEDGSWTGVKPEKPKLHVSTAVEQVVASSIADAMGQFAGKKAKRKPDGDPDLPPGYYDPEEGIARSITRDTKSAVQDVVKGLNAQDQELDGAEPDAQQLRAMRGPSIVTVKGCDCMKTYQYNGDRYYNQCTREGSERGWCYTDKGCGMLTADQKKSWDYCEQPLMKTVKGCSCDFPFTYGEAIHNSCMDSSRTFLWGPENAPGKGPRGLWCQTTGQCGEGLFTTTEGLRAHWDHCDPTPPRSSHVLREVSGLAVNGDTEIGEYCGQTIDEVKLHRRAFQFSDECVAGSICSFRCSNPLYCPSCAGGNCKCVSRQQKGQNCGDGSNRPPQYSNYECESEKCVFTCKGSGPDCADCNNGNCHCE